MPAGDPTLADLRSLYFRKANGETLSDAEYRELQAAVDAGYTFTSLVDLADTVSKESMNELYTKANRRWAYALTSVFSGAIGDIGVAGRARWFIVGDSYTELGALQRLNRYLSPFVDNFTDTGLTGRGEGWTQACGAAVLGNTLTTTGTENRDVAGGPLGYSLEITGSETIGPESFSGLGLTLYFDPDAGGTVDISIDGGTPVSFDTSTNNGVYTLSPQIEWLIDHTFTITNTAGTSRLWAYHPDTLNDIQVGFIGLSGGDLSNLITYQDETLKLIEQFDPDRVTIEFGLNDYIAGLDTYLANLETVVTAILADEPTRSLELYIAPLAGTRTEWPTWARRMRSKARELGMTYVDAYEALGSVSGADDVFGLSTDNTHLNSMGANFSAAAHLAAALPPSLLIKTPVNQEHLTYKKAGQLMRPGFYTKPPSTALGTLALTLNRAYYYPIHLTTKVNTLGTVLAGFGCEVTTAGGAGSVVRIALYTNSPYGNTTGDRPFYQFVTTSALSATSTGLKEELKDLYCPWGLVWIGIVAQVAAPTLRSFTPTIQLPQAVPTGSTRCNHYYEDGITAALPLFPASLTEGTSTTPLVFVKV